MASDLGNDTKTGGNIAKFCVQVSHGQREMLANGPITIMTVETGGQIKRGIDAPPALKGLLEEIAEVQVAWDMPCPHNWH